MVVVFFCVLDPVTLSLEDLFHSPQLAEIES